MFKAIFKLSSLVPSGTGTFAGWNGPENLRQLDKAAQGEAGVLFQPGVEDAEQTNEVFLKWWYQ